MKKIIPEKISKWAGIWGLRKIALYAVFTGKALSQYKKQGILREAITAYPRWSKTVRRNTSPLSYDQPWIVFKAKDYLDTLLHKEMVVWEYGSGSSTLYFARRVKTLYSIENDKTWYDFLSGELDRMDLPCEIKRLLFEGENPTGETLDAEYKKRYVSSSGLSRGVGFEKYARSISDMPDESLDIVIVNGRVRNGCIALSLSKVKKGGYLIVDNSSREAYFEGNEILWDAKQWDAKHFAGPAPYAFEFSRTSFFHKK